MTSTQPDKEKRLRKYIDQWTCWLKLGLTMIKELETCVHAFLPSLFLPASAKPRALARGLERSGYPTKPPGYAKGFAKASGEGGYALGYARLRRSESAGETRRRNIRYHGPWSMEFHIGARAPRRFRLGCRTDVPVLVHKRNVKCSTPRPPCARADSRGLIHILVARPCFSNKFSDPSTSIDSVVK